MDEYNENELEYYSAQSVEEMAEAAKNHLQDNQFDLAIEYYYRSFRILHVIDDQECIIYWLNHQFLGKSLITQRRFQEAKRLYLDMLNLLYDCTRKHPITFVNFYLKLADLCLAEGNIQEMNSYYMMLYCYLSVEYYKEQLFFISDFSFILDTELCDRLYYIRDLYREVLGEDSQEYYVITVRIGSLLNGHGQKADKYFQEAMEWNDRHYGPYNQGNYEIKKYLSEFYYEHLTYGNNRQWKDQYIAILEELLNYSYLTFGGDSKEYGEQIQKYAFYKYEYENNDQYLDSFIESEIQIYGLSGEEMILHDEEMLSSLIKEGVFSGNHILNTKEFKMACMIVSKIGKRIIQKYGNNSLELLDYMIMAGGVWSDMINNNRIEYSPGLDQLLGELCQGNGPESVLNMFHNVNFGVSLDKKEYISYRIHMIYDPRHSIKAFKSRQLLNEYAVVYLDVMERKMEYHTDDQSMIHMAIGITPEGKREILDYRIGPHQSLILWKELLNGFKQRSVKKVSLFCINDCNGLKEIVRELFPASRIQSSLSHVTLQISSMVESKKKAKVKKAFKAIYTSKDFESAWLELNNFEKQWGKDYPQIMNLISNDPYLFTFFYSPAQVRKYLYSTEIIEKCNSELALIFPAKGNTLPKESKEHYLVVQCSLYNQSEVTIKGDWFNV